MTDLTECMRWTMRHTFNNLRAILKRHKENMPVIVTAEMLAEIDEAESNWESDHCNMWKLKENDLFIQIHGTCYLVDEVKYWKCCPYCRKKLKLEVK